LQPLIRPFSGNASRLSLIGITLVVIVAFGSHLTVQTITENNVRQALLDEQEQRQIDNTDALGVRIAADLDSIAVQLQLLATDPLLQKGELASDAATGLLVQQYDDLNKITSVEGLQVLDQNNIVVNTGVHEHRQFIGSDLSQREYVVEVRESLQPYVSSSFTSLNDRLAFAVVVPIINRETAQYVGAIAARFVVPDFFKPYEDALQISSIVALDKNQVYISTTILEFLGLEYWGEQVQSTSRTNAKLNAVYSTLASGKSASTLFISAVTNDERFVSGSPIFYRGEQVMTVVITTPTDAVYAQVDGILLAQKTQTIATLAAVVAAISVLILYLSKWNSALEKKVKQRTIELETANERLKESDKLQKEFINIAAHELRTPIQPMLGVTEMMAAELDRKDKIEVSREDIELLARNANRLERLSSQILEVSRIEGGSVQLNLEPVDISTTVRNAIADVQSRIKKHIDIRYIEPENPLTVQADRTRLFEVLSNLLANAIKFTQDGSIIIRAERSDDGKDVIMRVIDTGSGIHPDIMPKLFTKFATKSDSGTGIGLYIAKNIIVAHGGRIWAENNRIGGATFSFTLPLADVFAKPENIQYGSIKR
jgi:signal transduction histidine kinase